VFSHHIATNLLKVLPATLLVGLSVNAVALAFAIALDAVDVYWVCASAVANSEATMRDRIVKVGVSSRLRVKRMVTELCS